MWRDGHELRVDSGCGRSPSVEAVAAGRQGVVTFVASDGIPGAWYSKRRCVCTGVRAQSESQVLDNTLGWFAKRTPWCAHGWHVVPKPTAAAGHRQRHCPYQGCHQPVPHLRCRPGLIRRSSLSAWRDGGVTHGGVTGPTSQQPQPVTLLESLQLGRCLWGRLWPVLFQACVVHTLGCHLVGRCAGLWRASSWGACPTAHLLPVLFGVVGPCALGWWLHRVYTDLRAAMLIPAAWFPAPLASRSVRTQHPTVKGERCRRSAGWLMERELCSRDSGHG